MKRERQIYLLYFGFISRFISTCCEWPKYSIHISYIKETKLNLNTTFVNNYNKYILSTSSGYLTPFN